MGAVMAVATVSGPLIGGVIVDTSWLGWRWCFYVCVPLAVISLVILQKYLHLPLDQAPGPDRLPGRRADQRRRQPAADLGHLRRSRLRLDVVAVGAVRRRHLAFGILAVVVENRVAEPLVPLNVVKQRTTALAIVASLAVGVAMFGSALFLGQYFQVARGYSLTEAGLLTIPMMLGSFLGSVGSGQLITRFGKWKRYLVAGGILLIAGLTVLGTIDHTTPYWYVGLGMLAMGLGMGMTMQNLVLAVQNTVDVSEIGASSATVSFFRSLGGAVGVSVLGAVLAVRVKDLIIQGLLAGPAAARKLQEGGSGSTSSARCQSPAAAVGGTGATVVRRRDRADLPDRGSVCGGQPDRVSSSRRSYSPTVAKIEVEDVYSGGCRPSRLRVRMMGERISHRTARKPLTAETSKVSRTPIQVPRRPPTTAPSGRTP